MSVSSRPLSGRCTRANWPEPLSHNVMETGQVQFIQLCSILVALELVLKHANWRLCIKVCMTDALDIFEDSRARAAVQHEARRIEVCARIFVLRPPHQEESAPQSGPGACCKAYLSPFFLTDKSSVHTSDAAATKL